MSNTSEKTSSGEWKFVGVVTVAVLVITSLPYAFAVLSAPPERYFTGFILNVSDHTQYLSWYKAFQTQYLIANRLTSEPNPPLFFNLLWWLLGRFGRYSGLNYIAVYQIFRWLAGAFFMVMVYGLASEIFPTVSKRRTAFLVILLGSGLGWILVVMKYTVTGGKLLFPLVVYVAEGNSFLSVLGYPHFAEAAGLILAVFWLLLVGERTGKLRYAVYAGLVAVWLGWQHTYDLLIVWGIPAAYAAVLWLLDRRWPSYWFKALVIVGLLSWPPALYAVLLTRLNPMWEEVLAQFANAGVYTPSLPLLLVFMGVPLMVALVTFALRLRDTMTRRKTGQSVTKKELFIGVWFIAGLALTYVPTDFQIHMINSWQVPVGLLATTGLFDYMLPALSRRRQPSQLSSKLALVFIMLVVPTNIYLLLWRFVDLNRHNYPFYLYRDEVSAMEWLESHAPPESIVFSALDDGQFIPGLSGQRAFLAHWAQTVNFFAKRDLVEGFFGEDTDDGRRRQILRQYEVGYVLYGPAEQALGEYVPDGSSFLQLAFSTPRIKVYRVSVTDDN